MADQVAHSIETGRKIRFVDLGDDSFALATALAGASGANLVTVEQAPDEAATITLLTSAARVNTAQGSAATAQANNYHRRMILFVDVTANTGSIDITPQLLVTDPVGGAQFTMWSAQTDIIATGTYAYYLADGASGGSYTESVPVGAPGTSWRFRMLHNNASSVTYSVSAVMLP